MYVVTSQQVNNMMHMTHEKKVNISDSIFQQLQQSAAL